MASSSPKISIRALSRSADLPRVRDLYDRCADYLTLEQGRPPNDALAAEFFTDAPPAHPPENMFKFGMFGGDRLIGVADLAIGYPDADAAFIGLLLLDRAGRGAGLGVTVLRHIEAEAQRRGARSLYLAVLDGNPRARAFWEREGFRLVYTVERRIGIADHIVHRMSAPLYADCDDAAGCALLLPARQSA